jgi:hypothetical protein
MGVQRGGIASFEETRKLVSQPYLERGKIKGYCKYPRGNIYIAARREFKGRWTVCVSAHVVIESR